MLARSWFVREYENVPCLVVWLPMPIIMALFFLSSLLRLYDRNILVVDGGWTQIK